MMMLAKLLGVEVHDDNHIDDDDDCAYPFPAPPIFTCVRPNENLGYKYPNNGAHKTWCKWEAVVAEGFLYRGTR
jgi:hypothetical protein